MRQSIGFTEFEISQFDGSVDHINPWLFFNRREGGYLTDADLPRLVEMHKTLYMAKHVAGRLLTAKEYAHAREMAKVVDSLDACLQELWGFPLDAEKRIHWSLIPGCICGDHGERAAKGEPRLYNPQCLLHGPTSTILAQVSQDDGFDTLAAPAEEPPKKMAIFPPGILDMLRDPRY